MLEKYYEILGVHASSTLSEIRKAYRQKAKAWHPDVNKSPDAHEKFVLLREAYEYLTDLKEGRQAQEPEVEYTWTEQRTEEARNRAETYAGMNYRDFKKSDYSRGGEAMEIIADHINLIFSFVLSVAILSVLTVAIGPLGFLIGLGFAAIAIFFSYHGVAGGVNLGRLFKAVWLIFSNRIVIGVIIFIFNFIMVLMVGFQTLIPLDILLLVYLGSIVLMVIILVAVLKIRKGFKLSFYPICIAPLMINMFLILNYVFSSNPVKEQYRFVKEMQHVRGGWQESTYINLADGKYDEYKGIRMFINYNELIGRNLVIYTFEDGLFGLRVMKSYELFQVLFHSNAEPEIIP
jgi:hypothetical protein